jgi:predicted amidohydrolase YtcJ
MGHEQRRGRIAVGQFADLAVLDRDILGLAPEEIETTRARLTFVGGEVVFSDGTLTVK